MPASSDSSLASHFDPIPTRGKVEVFSVRHPWDGVLRLVVRVPQGSPTTTEGYPGTAERAIERYPHMAVHRCANGHRLGIVHELRSTEVAHLLEHALIEEAVAAGCVRSEIRGETAWDFARDGHGVFRVRVHGIGSEALALAAARAAAWSVGEILATA